MAHQAADPLAPGEVYQTTEGGGGRAGEPSKTTAWNGAGRTAECRASHMEGSGAEFQVSGFMMAVLANRRLSALIV